MFPGWIISKKHSTKAIFTVSVKAVGLGSPRLKLTYNKAGNESDRPGQSYRGEGELGVEPVSLAEHGIETSD